MTTRYRLFHYWRSSASWRARWALELKGIPVELVPVNLLTGESESPEHLARNPMGYVPVLEVDGKYVAESTAILEWLEETHPSPRLLPGDPWARAHNRALCQLVNAGIQPLQNLNVTQFLSDDKAVQTRWVQHWIRHGMTAFETLARRDAGNFCQGDQVTMADLYLIPQCYAANRFEIDLAREYPLLEKVYRHALATPECVRASPDAYKPIDAS